ncbi:MAG: fructoselysine 3-epimerase [Lentisphaerae bacterium ADurb.BinA184]|nr:MAG: fructoselysine 3-epimerase [Lentisphaerae bacterium ADurb.BinA184]
MKLATTTADFRVYSETPAGLVRLFEGTGFRFLDLNLYRSIYPQSPFLDDRWEAWIEDAGAAAAALKMGFCQAHGPDGNLHATGEGFDVFLGATVRSIEACARLGIGNIVVHQQDIGGFPSREYRRQNLERNRAFFEKLFPAMERTGVRVLIENSCDRHAPTPQENSRNFPSTAAELLDLAEYLDHPLLHVCWDTGHANIQGVDQYRSLVELGERLRAVHIADNYSDADSHVAPFQGTTNMDAVMQGLLDAGYRGYFTFEACHILRDGRDWPNYRREWHYRGQKVTRLMDVPVDLKRQAVALLYQIGKHILQEYGCFEE